MDELRALVRVELKKKRCNKAVMNLFDNIFNCYEEGGEKLVKKEINKKVKEIGSKFKKEAEEMKIIAKLKKKRKRKKSKKKSRKKH